MSIFMNFFLSLLPLKAFSCFAFAFLLSVTTKHDAANALINVYTKLFQKSKKLFLVFRRQL